MNYNIWLLFEEFQSLSIGGKIAIVASHILVVLLLMLWEEFRVQRHNAKRSSTATLNPLSQPVEKLVHTVNTPCKRYNPNNRPSRGILNTFRNNWIQPHLYCERSNSGNTPFHPFRWHIRTIVNKLRRRVNQSGKEPLRRSLIY
jgi:hypothetical protein